MKCNVCELICEIDSGKFGRCGMYKAVGGAVVPRYSNQVSSFSVGHIEDVPILHFYPGSLTLLMGTVGCNFDCSYCMNSHVARASAGRIFRYRLTPEELVNKAVAAGCRNIAFTINEPAVSFPYFLRVAEFARKVSLKIGCATNGYFTEEAALSLAEQVDFVNLSLKSMSDKFYKEECRVTGVAPVLRNIELLFKKGVHLEITTPIIPEMDNDEIRQIAQFIGGISRNIPWHIFRLLPEYKMADGKHSLVGDLLTTRQIAMKYLNYVFIGNLVGSEWMDTICPKCGINLIKRINAIGCGSIVVASKLINGRCPHCGAEIPVVGEFSLPLPDAAGAKACSAATSFDSEEKALGLLDAQGYHRLFDFRTGETVASSTPLVDEVAKVTRLHPYPGDAKQEADTWVTDVALDLLRAYPAELVMLGYAQALFTAGTKPNSHRKALKNIFDNIERFLSQTDYEPLIWGCGGLEHVEHIVDLESILGVNQAISQSNGKYAFINGVATSRALPSKLKGLEKLSRVLTKQAFLDSLEEGYSDEFADNLGDYIAIAKPGVVFKGLGSQGRKQYWTPALSSTVPVYTTLKYPEGIVEVAPVVTQAIREGKKVALIIVEGAGPGDFPFPIQECKNRSGQFIYQIGEQYITLGTGVPYNKYRFPLSNRYWLLDSRSYPFSGRFHRSADYALSRQIGDKKSLSVGNRNIFTHVCLGSDITVECYCCYMHNYGSLAVFREEALARG